MEVFKQPARAGDGAKGAYYIETFGCQMNVRDSETAAGLLESIGYVPCQTKQEADVILFNTCCIRGT
jgi:tRNA-2-methylthio-N6-dimethylallyladenosine synthase